LVAILPNTTVDRRTGVWQRQGDYETKEFMDARPSLAELEEHLPDDLFQRLAAEEREEPQGLVPKDILRLEVHEDDLHRAISEAYQRFSERPVYLQIHELIGRLICPDRVRFGLLDYEDLRIANRSHQHRDRMLEVICAIQRNRLIAYDEQKTPISFGIYMTIRDLIDHADLWVTTEEAEAIWPELWRAVSWLEMPARDLPESGTNGTPPPRCAATEPPGATSPSDTISPNVRLPTALPLRGKALERALDEWAKKKWPSGSKLPGWKDLQQQAQAEFPECRITRDHARGLRKKYASEKAKRGGAPTHKPRVNT
jgi:hypothetical protein